MKKIAAYCRVSTDKDDQLSSLENQRSFFSREIEKAGHTLYAIYPDEGLSGTKLNNRPKFIEMLRDAGIDVHTVTDIINRRRKTHTFFDVSDREPLFDEIWIKNTSRFARNILSYEIISLLRAKRVNIHFMSEGIDTMDLSQDLLLKLMQVFDENDSRDKSMKTKWGNQESAKRNRIRCHPHIYGYVYDIPNNALIIIPEEAKVIQYIFQLYSEGNGIRQIIKKLTAEGFRSRNGKIFGKTTISRILRNEKYAGLNNPLRYDTGTVFIDSHYPKPKDDGEYAVMPNERIQPIVSQELFYACKARRESNINHRINKGHYTGLGPYAGLLRCANCGSVYHSNVDKGRQFYNCHGKKMNGTRFCSNPNVPAKMIDDLIDQLANGLYDHLLVLQGMGAIRYLNNAVLSCTSRFDTDIEEEVSRIDAEIAKLEAIRKRYYDLYALGSDDSLLETIADYNKQIEELQKQKQEASKDNNALLADIYRYNSLIVRIIDLIDTKSLNGTEPRPVDRQTVLQSLTSIIVDKDPDTGKAVLRPVLCFNTDITAEIGTDAWTADVPEELVEDLIPRGKLTTETNTG